MPSLIETRIYIDWDRDGSFATSGDDITNDVISAEWNNGFREAYQLTADESMLTLVLNNTTKKYSPEYTGGTYYGKLLPQRPVRIETTYDGDTLVKYTGWIEEVSPAPLEKGTQAAIITAKGAKQHLERSEVYLPLMENVTVDEVLEAIFGQVIFPPNVTGVWLLGLTGSTELGVTTFLVDLETEVYDFEEGVTNFSYVADNWADGITAYDAIARLMRSERGRFYFDSGGTAVFLNRHNLQSHYLNDGTVDNRMASATYAHGGDLHNVVRVTCSPRSITDGTVTLWSMDQAVRVDAGTSKTIRARFTDSSGGLIAGYNVGTPAISASTGITLESFTASARSAEAVFTNSAATHGSVTAMDITGRKLTSFNDIEVEEMDQQAITTYGKRVLPINCDLIDNEDEARTIAQYELMRRKTPRGTMNTVTMQQRDTTNAALMFEHTITDRLRIKEAKTATDGDYFIIGEEWTLRQNSKLQVKWTLEPVSSFQSSFLDIATTAELDQTAYLG